MKTKSVLVVFLLVALLALAFPAAPRVEASPACCPEPIYGTAVVDGNIGEWDLNVDYFAPLYRGGNPTKPVEAELYFRYDCDHAAMFVLILSKDGREVQESPAEAWIKLDGSPSPVAWNSFAWVHNAENVAIGWEASFNLEGVQHTLGVHTNVSHDGWQTAATEDGLCILIDCPPTAVVIRYFVATERDQAIVVRWATYSEIDNVGFNLYRARNESGFLTRLNAAIIPTKVPPGSPIGASYSFKDRRAMPGITYWYWLEAVDIYGHTDMYGPVTAMVPVPRQ